GSPNASSAATSPPILVPDRASARMPSSSSASSTPMCARPRAPPPPSTTATVRSDMGGALELDQQGRETADRATPARLQPQQGTAQTHQHDDAFVYRRQ